MYRWQLSHLLAIWSPHNNSSDEQSTGEVDEENIESEIVTFDNDLLSLVNSLFS